MGEGPGWCLGSGPFEGLPARSNSMSELFDEGCSVVSRSCLDACRVLYASLTHMRLHLAHGVMNLGVEGHAV